MTTAATMIATKTLTAKQVAYRAAKRDAQANTRAAKIMAKVISNRFCIDEEVAHVADYLGRPVRQGKATDMEIRHFLIGNRVVDSIAILEELGASAFDKLVANGTLIRDASFNRYSSNNVYWVSAKGRDIYDLPARIKLASGALVDYAA